jgi:hypothetical protein
MWHSSAISASCEGRARDRRILAVFLGSEEEMSEIPDLSKFKLVDVLSGEIASDSGIFFGSDCRNLSNNGKDLPRGTRQACVFMAPAARNASLHDAVAFPRGLAYCSPKEASEATQTGVNRMVHVRHNPLISMERHRPQRGPSLH